MGYRIFILILDLHVSDDHSSDRRRAVSHRDIGTNFSILVTGDSIIKLLRAWRNVRVLPKPGKDIQGLHSELKPLKEFLRQFDLIIVHIGTNNIERDSQFEIERQLRRLVWDLRQMLPGVRIGLSCILPRPRDEGNSYIRGKVIRVNNFMIEFAEQYSMICIRTYSPFLHGGFSKDGLFAYDGLHLRSSGLRLLRRFWKNQLGDNVLFPRLRALEQEGRV